MSWNYYTVGFFQIHQQHDTDRYVWLNGNKLHSIKGIVSVMVVLFEIRTVITCVVFQHFLDSNFSLLKNTVRNSKSAEKHVNSA